VTFTVIQLWTRSQPAKRLLSPYCVELEMCWTDCYELACVFVCTPGKKTIGPFGFKLDPTGLTTNFHEELRAFLSLSCYIFVRSMFLTEVIEKCETRALCPVFLRKSQQLFILYIYIYICVYNVDAVGTFSNFSCSILIASSITATKIKKQHKIFVQSALKSNFRLHIIWCFYMHDFEVNIRQLIFV
jgi:hypothetical protein